MYTSSLKNSLNQKSYVCANATTHRSPFDTFVSLKLFHSAPFGLPDDIGRGSRTYEFWDMHRLMAQLGFIRRNVFKAFFIIALGLITMTADATVFFGSDLLFPFSGLLAGIVVVILGVHWMGKTLLALGKTD